MKRKLYIIFLIFPLLILIMGKNVSNANEYEESKETLRNPDRGFYKLVQIELQEGNENFSDFEDTIEDISEEDTDVSIISFQLNLKNFVSKTQLLEKKIEDINQYFSIMREYGYQVIFRVVYDSEGKENPEPEFDEILTQIESLKDVYTKNEDIILVVEAGFLGSYGEWHDGKYDEDKEKRNELIKKLLSTIPESIQINLRKPSFITDYIGNDEAVTKENAFSNDEIARLGLHNDGYLASDTDLGTYEEDERNESLIWQEKQTLFTIFGGECQNKDSIYTDLEKAISDMKKRHCVYLNKTYDREVKEKWKQVQYSNNSDIYNGETGYKYIQDHLGYRLVLRESDMQIQPNTRNIEIEMNIENVGFANIVRKKQVEVILKNGDKKYNIKTDIDIREEEKDGFYEFTILEKIPENIDIGNYEVYVNIQEPFESLQDNDNYKIKLANIDMWDTNVGGNHIGNIEISEINNTGIPILKIILILLVIGITAILFMKLKNK